MGVIGDWESGNRLWLSRKERGTVVHKALRYVRERAKIGRAQKIRIIWIVNSEESEQSEAYSAILAQRIGDVALAGPGGKRKRRGRKNRAGSPWSHLSH
jgi:hypothetical protein